MLLFRNCVQSPDEDVAVTLVLVLAVCAFANMPAMASVSKSDVNVTVKSEVSFLQARETERFIVGLHRREICVSVEQGVAHGAGAADNAVSMFRGWLLGD